MEIKKLYKKLYKKIFKNLPRFPALDENCARFHQCRLTLISVQLILSSFFNFKDYKKTKSKLNGD